MATDNLIEALCSIVERDDAGRHFTNTCPVWAELEAAGLIKITRPVHPQTGIIYAPEFWGLEFTEDGLAEIDACQ